MINKNWPERPLGELFEIGAGKTMSAAAREGDNKTPFLRTSNVLWNEIDLTTVDEMSIPPHELQEKLLLPGDLLVCEGGEIGRAAIWNGERAIMSFQNHIHRLRPLRDDVEPRFYAFFLQSAFTQLGIFEGAGNKTTIPNLSRNRLSTLDVPHPELGEQKDIARVLARVREAISTHDRSSALARELKHAAIQSLFSSGMRNEPQKESEIGRVPESWNVSRLESCVERPDYGYTASGVSEPVGPRFLRITDVQDGTVNWSTVPFCVCDDEILRTKRLNSGDIVVARIGATTGKAYLIQDAPEAVFASYMIRLRARRSRVLPDFLYYYLQGQQYWHHIDLNKGDRLKGGVNIPVLLALPIPLPSIEEQSQISATLQATDAKIDLHRRKRAQLDDLFRSLLHKLMTGRIRGADLDLSVLEVKHVPEIAA